MLTNKHRITAETAYGNLGSYIGISAIKPFINSNLILGEILEF